MSGGSIAPVVPLVCVGPIKYKGLDDLRRDIENLKNAAARVKPHAGFHALGGAEQRRLE